MLPPCKILISKGNFKMAERRMFSLKIIDSDIFSDMPTSAQALYFQLGLRADDDGFVGNPKKIQKLIGCRVADMKRLITDGFIIIFESGVVVIRHWKVNNQIKGDRYRETIYLKEKALLCETETKAYELKKQTESDTERNQSGTNLDTERNQSGTNLDTKRNQSGTNLDTKRNQSGTNLDTERNQSGTKLDTQWNQLGTNLEPQYSIGKDSIGKDSLGEVSTVEVRSVPSSSVDGTKGKTAEAAEEEEEEEKHQKGKEGRKEEPIMVLPLKDGKGYPLFEKHVTTWDFMYPFVDIMREFGRMKDFLDVHPEERIPASAMNMFMMNWLRREQEKIKNRKN